ncbi:cholecystokinin-like [Mobula hypostoma]|uniref:cholecystokinin-like n=1 Tax=Mobula hypostoma TaxID=723540 RepID=UPI002FC3C020
MANTAYVSLLVVVLATGCLSKALSDPHSDGGAGVLDLSGKHPSTFRAGSLGRRAPSLRVDGLISRLMPQIQQAGLSHRANHYQLRDLLHQMKDRDYTGWMDFGRRSAEDYEVDS